MSEGVKTEDSVSNTSREKTTQWLEEVLGTYFTHLEKIESNGRGPSSGSPPVTVEILDFDIGPGFCGDGRLNTLSDLLSIKVWFKIVGSDEERTEDLIVKIPPSDHSDREMAHLAQVDKREIHFYTEALVQLEEWAKSRGAEIKINVPRCYFAKYHAHSGPGGEGSSLGEAESVLVLQDIRPLGYSMRDFATGLTLEETLCALREIAIVHAVSWAMQEVKGQPLFETWEFAYRSRKAASAYKLMIEQGFPTLAGFLEKQEPDGKELLRKLKALHPKAVDLLCELLDPPPPPAPSCLTHMDFWCNNLLFRTRTPPDGSEESTTTTTDETQQLNGNASSSRSNNTGDPNTDVTTTECQILDWQMMAISRPTHDVALLLFTSLTPKTRIDNINTLLHHYWDVFQSTAQKLKIEVPFTFEVLEAEFKKSQILALLLVIGSIDMALDTEATEERLIQALRDMAEQNLI